MNTSVNGSRRTDSFRAIQKCYKKNCEKTSWIVVIPVVEYDKPLLQSIDKINLQEANCATPKAFYGNHKSYNEYIRFAFLTGFT